MTVAEELYDRWIATGTNAIVVVGTAKNVGKTTTVESLLRVAARRGTMVGLTSIGRDGEAFDAVDGSPKPRLLVEPGTLVAAGRALLPHPRTIDVCEERENSALGPIVFYRSKIPQHIEISGPPTARAMRSVIGRFAELGTERVIVDGAIDRVAVTAGADDAVVVATGASLAPTLEATVAATREFVARLKARVIACTVCPLGEDRSFEPEALVREIARALELPTYDIKADLRS